MSTPLPIDGIGLRAPDTRYPEAESLQDADTMNGGLGWGLFPVFAAYFLLIGGVGCGLIAFVVWFVVKVIESFV